MLIGILVFILSAPNAFGATVTEFPITGDEPYGITAGPDGALWFTESESDQIGRITTAGTLTQYSIPGFENRPKGITVGPDGALWFGSFSAGQLGRITTAGNITEFPAGAIEGIVSGPDGALWATHGGGSNSSIDRYLTTGALTNQYFFGGFEADPQDITVGADGALWFTERIARKVSRITTAGAITEYAVPGGGAPTGIAAGPDGALWFTFSRVQSDYVGRITIAGAITEYPVPGAESGPQGIVKGPDGALWFTEGGSGQIGRITTGGEILEFAVPGGTGRSITVGSDGALWFTETGSNKIGRITTDLPPAPDRTPPAASLGARKTQRALKQGGIVIEVACTNEACTATAEGTASVPGAAKVYRLKPVTKQLAKGAKAKLKLAFTRKTKKAVKKALRKRKKVTAKVKVTVRDRAGNTATKAAKVRVTR